jgi:hypothetical protein
MTDSDQISNNPCLVHREKEDTNYRIAAGKVMVIPTPTAEPFKATIVGL